MARPRRRIPAGRPARHRPHFVAAAGRNLPQCTHHRLRRLRGARRAHRLDPPLPRAFRAGPGRTAAHPGRRLDALLRAADPQRRQHHSDEFAAPTRRPRRARRQALQRHRASGRGHNAVHRHGAGPARRAAFRRRRFSPPTATPACWCSRTSATSWWSAAIRRHRSKRITRSRSICWPRCTASLCRIRCRSNRASPTSCRFTTWMRC